MDLSLELSESLEIVQESLTEMTFKLFPLEVLLRWTCYCSWWHYQIWKNLLFYALPPVEYRSFESVVLQAWILLSWLFHSNSNFEKAQITESKPPDCEELPTSVYWQPRNQQLFSIHLLAMKQFLDSMPLHCFNDLSSHKLALTIGTQSYFLHQCSLLFLLQFSSRISHCNSFLQLLRVYFDLAQFLWICEGNLDFNRIVSYKQHQESFWHPILSPLRSLV